MDKNPKACGGCSPYHNWIVWRLVKRGNRRCKQVSAYTFSGSTKCQATFNVVRLPHILSTVLILPKYYNHTWTTHEPHYNHTSITQGWHINHTITTQQNQFLLKPVVGVFTLHIWIVGSCAMMKPPVKTDVCRKSS